MLSRAFPLLILPLFFVSSACAHGLTGLRRGDDLREVTPAEVVRRIPPGSVLILGENHGLAAHRDQHLTLLRGLRDGGHRVSVGLEFFPFPFQPLVDEWRQGRFPEALFLERIQWGRTPFEFYRPQAEFPRLEEGSRTWALNSPPGLSSRLVKVGLEGLSAAERAHLPPRFSLGRESYRRRFLEMMPHLPDPSVGERYFLAQSLWDDTMAWRAVEFLRQNPGQTLVIVVGEFHVQYGGGLPDRLRARAPGVGVFTLSQLNVSGWSSDEIAAAVRPSPRDGVRAHWVWVSESPVASP
ncbi:MAG: ChaN family lipoprotein [Bdellovibrionaceae bacterium]|nr:ChaN family lipoprotein [Pseudobdellovibrionaceae bacterium]